MRRNGFIAGVIATLLAVVISFGAYRFVVNRSEFLNGVGRIPGGDFNSLITLPDGVDLTFPELIGKMIGPQIEGNRVLLIGDSIFASTSSRYGNEMCNTLEDTRVQIEDLIPSLKADATQNSPLQIHPSRPQKHPAPIAQRRVAWRRGPHADARRVGVECQARHRHGR